MPFSARNARYLRISSHTVLPLYIYLDDKHIEWMTDYILQRVLADLRPHIGPKLRAESSIHGTGGSASARKGSVEVHRADTYQFAYFFRKNEPHAVLIKSRRFVPATAPVPMKVPPIETQVPKPKQQKRKRDGVTNKPARLQNTRGKEQSVALSDNEENTFEVSGRTAIEGDEPRRSRRAKRLVAGGYKESAGDDVEMNDPDPQDIENQDAETDRRTQPAGDVDETSVDQDGEDHNGDTSQPSQQLLTEPSEIEPGSGVSQIFDIDAEQEEEKPKMAMRISYQGFTIYDRCLCVVIEPWPPQRDATHATSRAPSLAPSEMRLSSVAPSDQYDRTASSVRERTPLFLPEIDPRRSLTPAPLPSRIMPLVPLFDDSMEPDDGVEETGGGMLAFSQVLKSVGGERAENADEDAYEGDMFLGE